MICEMCGRWHSGPYATWTRDEQFDHALAVTRAQREERTI